MCNFVIRPIKSYATVNVVTVSNGSITTEMERGEYLDVKYVTQEGVYGHVNGVEKRRLTVPFDVFTHSFTANPEDVKTVKDEEPKWFKPEAKK